MLKTIPEVVAYCWVFKEFDEHLKEDKVNQVAKSEDEYAAWAADRQPLYL